MTPVFSPPQWQAGLAPHAAVARADGQPLSFADARLEQLLQMAGPELGPELLRHLVADLHSVERGLVQAGCGPDWPVIGGQSHVLISLAGTVGAVALQARAQALNQIAHRQETAPLAAGLAGVLSLLDPLIRQITALRDTWQPPPTMAPR